MTALANLVAASQRVTNTSSRLAKVRELAEHLRVLEADELPIAIAFLSGETRQGKLGVSYAVLRSASDVEVASSPSLTLHDVDIAFQELVAIKGAGSGDKRKRALATLFANASAEEQDFLSRLIVGELRQGALAALMLEAIAAASQVPLADVRRAAMFAGGLADVAQAAMSEGAVALARFSIKLMQPVMPMLSQSANDIETALTATGTAAIEWKLDGARIQVHKSGDDVRVYTRSLNDVTERVPEIVAMVRELKSHALILDGEAIALRADGTPHSFQITMRRFGRKLEVDEMRRTLPLSAFFFDCLMVDDQTLADHPAHERFDALVAALPPSAVIPRIVTDDVSQAAQFFEDALVKGHEGVMVKSLDAPYEAGRRGAGWIKVKRANTLDLVVLAAEWGSGRRSGKLSNLHLGARDAENGGYVMLGKTFKGLTDQMLEWQTQEFEKHATTRDAYTAYLQPVFVVEIAFNEIQASPRYPAGLALRFARVKGYRPDKRPEEADTIVTVRELYSAQVHTDSA